jgi:hypothetical protein
MVLVPHRLSAEGRRRVRSVGENAAVVLEHKLVPQSRNKRRESADDLGNRGRLSRLLEFGQVMVGSEHMALAAHPESRGFAGQWVWHCVCIRWDGHGFRTCVPLTGRSEGEQFDEQFAYHSRRG